MAIQKFEDMVAWQKAQSLAVDIYEVFKHNKDFGFKDQICRAVVSISNNTAEGFDRSSDADFCRFLYIAISSCSEVKSMLHLAEKLKYISSKQKNLLLGNADEVSKIIRGLIKSLDSRKVKSISNKPLMALAALFLSICDFYYIAFSLPLNSYA